MYDYLEQIQKMKERSQDPTMSNLKTFYPSYSPMNRAIPNAHQRISEKQTQDRDPLHDNRALLGHMKSSHKRKRR